MADKFAFVGNQYIENEVILNKNKKQSKNDIENMFNMIELG